MTDAELRQAVMELALFAKEYQLATGPQREALLETLRSEVETLRATHGEAVLTDIIRRVEQTMNGARFPLL